MLEPEPESVARLFDRLAPAYDRFNRVSSLGLDRLWRRRATADLKPGWNVLDIGCGTGDLSLAALRKVRPAGRVTGVDFSESMLGLARGKASRVKAAGISFIRAGADRLPFDDGAFDAVVSAFVLRSLAAICAREIRRVLRPGGMAFLLELNRPSVPGLRQMHSLYLRIMVPAIGRLMAGSRWPRDYLESTVFRFPEPEVYGKYFTDAGMECLSIERLSLGAASLLVLRASR
jgi:demethylmenaquinone methyltransferase/2-methoxy-6-polyprenyl-1,4-benzoquinol methylase